MSTGEVNLVPDPGVFSPDSEISIVIYIPYVSEISVVIYIPYVASK